ncbi:uncharacterized protein FA14DRAFT_40475 [Meira miltonrushii]|uniref:Uncharacterized protein n=1 Tax=Meira miltonrushii TaxID=1280837 RepID=A0A316VCZ9_9BASI|nr:uncharacterized protein FA14DRAFT_40475 [Meira miltonrushii]PWN35360.1 hypothetical protein FA14DRAFT_40475 [Meira miltonrushii]
MSTLLHPLHCNDGCNQGAGPSRSATDQCANVHPSSRRRKASPSYTKRLVTLTAILSLLTGTRASFPETPTKPESIATLIKRRKDLLARDFTAANNLQQFDINVSPPKSCEPIQIVFSTLGGLPPFTVFIGFDNWYSYSTSIPSTYADPNVNTWLYEFDVPNFANNSTFPDTPEMFVIVGDSTGKLLNTSIFQTVQTSNLGCQRANVPLDFTFYTSNNSNACSDIQVNWESMSNTSVTFTAPMDLYLIPAQQPPLHIAVPNVTALTLNTTLSVQPGSPYMFAMTDAHGIGGVSGYNIVGLNEYEGQNCLISPTLTQGMPTPTATLAADVRMPDYSGLVSSLVTSNGVVSTATSVEVIKDGSLPGANLSSGQIAGLSVGVAIGAGLLAALISWYLWRKRHGRKTVFWDLPKGANGELGKSEYGAPIDRNYLRSVNSPPSSTSNRVGVVPTSPHSESSDERERARDTVYSDQSSRAANDAVQSPNGWTSSGFNTYTPPGSARYNSIPSTEQPDSPLGTGPEAFNAIRSSSMSESSTGGNPFMNASTTMSSTASQQRRDSSARNYRPRSEGIEANASTFGSALPLIETRFLGNSSSQGNSDSPHSSNGDHRNEGQSNNGGQSSLRHSVGTDTANRDSRGPTQILQHRDAGLLMDDSLDDEELMGRVELPPSYHQISRPGNRDVPRPRSGDREGQSSQEILVDAPRPGQNSNNTQTQQEDEREFWLSNGSV